MLDTLRKVETPEGVELALRLASPLPRAAAWLIDTLIRIAGINVLSGILALGGGVGWGLLFIANFAALWLYWVFFEVLWDGATPGKRLMRLRVVHDDGTPVTWGSSIVRNTVRFVDTLPLGYGIGLMSCLIDKEGRRLGDLAAGTVVVHESDPDRVAGEQVEWLAPVALDTPLSSEERRAVVSFAERHAMITADRAEEIAAIAGEGLTPGRKLSATRLREIAAWLAGRS